MYPFGGILTTPVSPLSLIMRFISIDGRVSNIFSTPSLDYIKENKELVSLPSVAHDQTGCVS